ncbi:hypothetical protein COCVIDRAFT_109134, partial [Bipolaris victoriae FI3]
GSVAHQTPACFETLASSTPPTLRHVCGSLASNSFHLHTTAMPVAFTSRETLSRRRV